MKTIYSGFLTLYKPPDPYYQNFSFRHFQLSGTFYLKTSIIPIRACLSKGLYKNIRTALVITAPNQSKMNKLIVLYSYNGKLHNNNKKKMNYSYSTTATWDTIIA